jgi:hypothetical protein
VVGLGITLTLSDAPETELSPVPAYLPRGGAVLIYGVDLERRGVQAMSKGKIIVLLLAILILNLSVAACGFTSQGSQQQNRPAENQNPPSEDKTEPALEEQTSSGP